MPAKKFHLAQFNIARLIAPLDDPQIAGFVAQLEILNTLAEDSPGFVWRLAGDNGNSTNIRTYDDERILVNMSVWESIEALFEYTYRSDHVGAFRDRRQWFEPLPTPYLVMWWVPAGVIPTALSGKHKLEYLAQHGPSPQAFTFKKRFPPPGE